MDKRIDLLERRKFVKDIIRLVDQLSENQKGCCFAIEGSWGIGKTFILEMIEKVIEDIGKDRYFLFHYNCWQYDYYEEPSVAIISALINSILEDKTVINKHLENNIKAGYKVVGQKLMHIAANYLENKIGIDLISLADEIKNKKEEDERALYEFDKMFNFNQTIESVRSDLQEIANERTIVLVVDELDRCIPQYAIKVLERLHHIFYGLANVVVIIAIDRKQLEHSVEEMFGIGGMHVEKYLKKFIDFSVELDYGSVNNFFVEKYSYYFDRFIVAEESEYKNEFDNFFSELFRETDIRTQEKLMEKVNIVHSVICTERVDMSVAVFEIMFAVLNLWEFGNIRNLVLINDAHYVDLEGRLGSHKMNLLCRLEKEARENGTDNHDNTNERYTLSNLFGRAFWYFEKIFIGENVFYMIEEGQYNEELGICLQIARKYCDYSKIIK